MKLCSECGNCRIEARLFSITPIIIYRPEYLCAHKDCADPVFGRAQSCEAARAGRCGVDGEFYAEGVPDAAHFRAVTTEFLKFLSPEPEKKPDHSKDNGRWMRVGENA